MSRGLGDVYKRQLLFKDLESILDKKSSIELNVPFSFLSKTIFSEVISPTFLTADKPNSISLLLTVKSDSLLFISGVETLTPISLASERNIAVLSLSLFTAVNEAAIYSAG